jgi:lauroyl/myristoyl acyltransferase
VAEVDIDPLLASLAQADFIAEIDGLPISGRAPALQGPLGAFIGHYIRLPVALLIAHHAPLPLALRLLRLRLASRRDYLLRRIRGNMRATPALGGTPATLDVLARENYDAIVRMYLERMLLLELPPRRMIEWLRSRSAVSGLEHLTRAHEQGRGAILVGFHFGSFSLLPYLVASRGFPATYLDGSANGDDDTIARRRAEVREAGTDVPLT